MWRVTMSWADLEAEDRKLRILVKAEAEPRGSKGRALTAATRDSAWAARRPASDQI